MENAHKKISIITVVYNGKDTIEKTINSVINQSYKNIEYIIIDGMSTDGTLDIVKKYADKIDVLVSETDQGIYDAMNKGIIYASGEIVGIINSDDYYDNETLKKVVEKYEESDADVVYGNAVFFDGKGYETIYKCGDIENLWYKPTLPHPSVFIKRSVYMQYGLFNISYTIGGDRELLLRYYSNGVKFEYLNETLSYFRLGGTSSNELYKAYLDAKDISMKYINKCPEKEKFLPKIERNLMVRRLKALSIDNSCILLAGLNNLLCNKNIVIFGGSSLGIFCIHFLKINNYNVEFCVDNDCLKWNQSIEGVVITSPLELKGYSGNVLITPYENEDVIRKQLKNINDSLNIVSIVEWAKNVMMFEQKEDMC